MSNTFNTLISDLSVVVEAINFYQAGRFREAMSALLQLLDTEPENWDARLMLAVCYYKTGQIASAHRAFTLIVEKTNSLEIRHKALEGAELMSVKMQGGNSFSAAMPAEFGCHVEQLGMRREPMQLSWL
jgi:thioredoxin-like negative regulator of GroEL